MPEGKLRSGVYRSFIMCDDPRGVVDSGAIKKQSKSRCSNNQRFEQTLKSKEISKMAPRKSTEVWWEAPPSSSLHLSRVSKGIKKLNVSVDLWSKGFSYQPVRPQDIAKDLLRGALDLEESLAMLSSLQEDDIKQKQRISKDRRVDSRFQRSISERFEKPTMIEENVATKDCYEELRSVVRESFLMQNLLPQTTTTTGTKTRVVRSDFASSSRAASSSSSSQSSMVSGSTMSSASSERAPSLIAKLMGLDVSPQEPAKSTVNHIDKQDILKLSSERQEQLKKKKKKKKEAIPETVRSNSTREAVLQSFPEKIPIEDPSTNVLIRPMRVVQPETEEKLENKRPALHRKPRMQGEVHPRMINQRKDYHAMGASKTSSKELKLPLSRTKKDRETKETLRKVEENEGKVIRLMSPSNSKAVTREPKPKETNKNIFARKEDRDEGKDRYRHHERALKPPNNPASHMKASNPSDMSRNKSRPSRLSSSSSSSVEQKSSSREKKSIEARRPNAKRKVHQHDNDLASENNSGSSLKLSTEETTSSEVNNVQGRSDNGEVTSCAATIQHSHEPETSQISLRSFLSKSPEFLKYAEDLFDFDTSTKRSQESAFQNRDSIVISDQRLGLAFAEEVATRRSVLLLAEQTCLKRSSVNFDELVMEVCDEFDSMRRYRDTFLEQNIFVKENIQILLEKDLESKKTELTSGVWDLGWRSEFRINETRQSVVDLEKLILSGLIHEILS